METKKILVTGGAGFIGSHLVERLVDLGHNVIVLDDLSNGEYRNLTRVLDSIDVVKGSVTNIEVVRELLKNTDAVFHLAARIDVSESIEKPELYFDVNVKGTFIMTKESKNVSTFVFASSSSVYGDPVYIPIDEFHPLMPKSPYAASKVAGESFVLSFANNGYRPVVIRLFNVYGPRQSKAYAGVITRFFERILLGLPPIIYGDGEQTRDFVYVDDVVDVLTEILNNEKAMGVYNIGSGQSTTINELSKMIARITGREDLIPVHLDPRPGDIRFSQANIRKAEKELNYKPKTNLEDGLKKTFQYISTAYYKEKKNT